MVDIIGREGYVVNPKDYILLEGKSGKDGYLDLWVCKYRLGLDDTVKNAGKKLGLKLENTAEEKNGREYSGRINWKQALKLNLILGGKTLNTRTGKDFLNLLFFGKAFDGNGEKISKKELSQVAEEITGVKSHYRAEWLEDYFTRGNDGLTLNKNYVLQNSVLVPEYFSALTSCLMDNKTPGISLKSWLENSTAQGYPRKNVKSGELWYWHPRQDFAVRFLTDPDYSNFDCPGFPRDSIDSLGVRHVREAGKNN